MADTPQEFLEPEVDFDVNPFKERFYDFQNTKAQYEAAKSAWETKKAQFKRLAGNANRFVLDGVVVATHAISGAFNKSKLEREMPHLYEEFLREVTVQVFDEEAFARKYPQIFYGPEFRARALRFKL